MKLILVSVLFLFVAFSVFGAAADDYTVDGDTVYIDNDDVYLSATPHTIASSSWVYFNLTSKQYSGNIDAAWGFNTSVSRPTKAELYAPHWVNTTSQHSHTFYNVSSFVVYTGTDLDYGNSYNTNYSYTAVHEVTTYNETTMEPDGVEWLTSNASFDSFVNDDGNYTIYWHTRHDKWTLWKDKTNTFDSITHDYQGYDKWYYIKDVNVNAGQQYLLRAWVEVPISLKPQSGKYYYAVKPSAQTIPQAIAAGNFYALDPWWNSSWQYYKTITINHSMVNQSIGNVDFPLLVSITDADLASHALTSGYDIVFTDSANGTQLAHEQEYWNKTTGVYVGWVNVSDIVNVSYINMYYGNPSATDTSNPEGVWDVNYIMVQHLQETDIDGGAGDIKDSTSYGNDGTTYNMNANDQVTGQNDGGFNFDGDNNYIDIDASTSLNNLSNYNFSCSFWFNGQTTGTYQNIINWKTIASTSNVFQLVTQSNGNPNIALYIGNGSSTTTTGYKTFGSWGGWAYITATSNGNYIKLYSNGDEIGSNEITISEYTKTTGIRFSEDNYATNGTIDEVRISNKARSAPYIQTDYNNTAYPDLFIALSGEQDADYFNSTWNTSLTSTGSSNSDQIHLPLESGGNYNFRVWWGDGSDDLITAWDQAEVNHTYASEGEYDIQIEGTIQGWRFNNVGDKLKILNVTNWGNLNLGNTGSYFDGCSNFNSTAVDVLDLTGTTSLNNAFRSASSFNGNISFWDISDVTTLYGTFRSTPFNQDISSWDTSNVWSMNNMFIYASSFNQDIGNWDVTSLTDATDMFNGVTLNTTNYNSLLTGWASLPSLQNAVPFHGGNSLYSCDAESARNDTLIGAFNWSITDGGLTGGPCAPTITLVSQTPSTIYQNSTGYMNISYGITHSVSGLNNTSVSFIYRNYDPLLGCSNHSIMVPDNDKAAEWSLDGRIIRAQNRNETLNFEDNASITGGDIYTWSGLDENTTRLTIVPVNSTYTLVYINATIHDVMPQMWYLDRTDMEEAPKTLMGIHKTQNVLIKLWNLELFKGNYDHITAGYTDTDLEDNPALHPSDANPLNYYYINDSYNPATDGDPLTSGYAFYMGSGNASEWVDYVYSPHTNSSYVRSFINNTVLNQYINTTEISYLYLTSNTPSSKPYYINVTDVSSSTNVSFSDTETLWAGDTTLTQQSYTPNVWLAFMKEGITFDHKLYVADNNDVWGNSTLSSTEVGPGEFPPTKPTFNAFHFNGDSDFDMNGTYTYIDSMCIGVGTDPDGGIVTHNITLHYDNGTYVDTLNNTLTNQDIVHNGVYAHIDFNVNNYSTLYNYTLRAIATDDESESVTVWLGVNFSLNRNNFSFTNISVSPTTVLQGHQSTISIDISDFDGTINTAIVKIKDTNYTMTNTAGNTWSYTYSNNYVGKHYITNFYAQDNNLSWNSTTSTSYINVLSSSGSGGNGVVIVPTATPIITLEPTPTPIIEKEHNISLTTITIITDESINIFKLVNWFGKTEIESTVEANGIVQCIINDNNNFISECDVYDGVILFTFNPVIDNIYNTNTGTITMIDDSGNEHKTNVVLSTFMWWPLLIIVGLFYLLIKINTKTKKL